MRYVMVVFRGEGGRVPGAERLRRAGFTLSDAVGGGGNPEGGAAPSAGAGATPGRRALPFGGRGLERALPMAADEAGAAGGLAREAEGTLCASECAARYGAEESRPRDGMGVS